MAFEPRKGKPYLWATWLTGLVSGEKHCAWAPWFKAHFKYDKRPQDNENALLKWQADHAAMVAVKAAALRMDGYDVTVESQNAFSYVGRSAVVGAKPDIIVTPPTCDGFTTIVDCKTGKERDSDVAQVALYMLLAPDSRELQALKALPIRGEVAYQARTRQVSYEDARALLPAIVARVQSAAGDVEPPTTPSAGECAFCDIFDCRDRVDDASAFEPVPVEDAVF